MMGFQETPNVIGVNPYGRCKNQQLCLYPFATLAELRRDSDNSQTLFNLLLYRGKTGRLVRKKLRYVLI